MEFELKFIGLKNNVLGNHKKTVKADSLENAIGELKKEFSIVHRVQYQGLYV